MSAVAIVVAAGAGTRMGAGMPKALVPLVGRPMLAWSIDAFARCAAVEQVVVVAPPGRVRDVEMAIGASISGLRVVPGGDSRAASVRAGLAEVGPEVERVLVHDAARPLVTPALAEAVLAEIDGHDGAIAAAPVADTLKRAGEDLAVAATVDRAGLWAAQTPQGFLAESLRAAIAEALAAGRLDDATDCASLVEEAGGIVRLVPNGAPNPKVTIPSDLALAAWLLEGRAAAC